MDEFFFDANDKDKPAHVIGFHDIGGGAPPVQVQRKR